MAGTSPLLCQGFIESEGFERSKKDLKSFYGLTDRDLDDRLDALLWALRRGAELQARQIPGRNLWVAAIPRGIPPLRIFIRPRSGVPTECELVWIEERFD